MLQPPLMGSFCGGFTNYFMGPLLPFPLALVVWARYGFSWPVPKLEGGGLYPTPYTQLQFVGRVTRPDPQPPTEPNTQDSLKCMSFKEFGGFRQLSFLGVLMCSGFNICLQCSVIMFL